MAFISDSDKQRIRDAIRRQEMRTAGELVTVLAQASDAYSYIPVLWAALAALFFPGIVGSIINMMPLWLEADYQLLYLVQVVLFFALAAVFQWTPLKMRLIPKSVKHHRARRLAHEVFFEQGLHTTQGGTGILIFVSTAEHYVEILADSGINEKVGADAWQHLVDRFVAHVKQGKTVDGFITTIEACGELLAQHFPDQKTNPNELPDHLVEL